MNPLSMMPMVVDTPRRQISSSPTAMPASRSAPLQPPASSAAAIAAGTTDTPACRIAASCVSS